MPIHPQEQAAALLNRIVDALDRQHGYALEFGNIKTAIDNWRAVAYPARYGTAKGSPRLTIVSAMAREPLACLERFVEKWKDRAGEKLELEDAVRPPVQPPAPEPLIGTGTPVERLGEAIKDIQALGRVRARVEWWLKDASYKPPELLHGEYLRSLLFDLGRAIAELDLPRS